MPHLEQRRQHDIGVLPHKGGQQGALAIWQLRLQQLDRLLRPPAAQQVGAEGGGGLDAPHRHPLPLPLLLLLIAACGWDYSDWLRCLAVGRSGCRRAAVGCVCLLLQRGGLGLAGRRRTRRYLCFSRLQLT